MVIAESVPAIQIPKYSFIYVTYARPTKLYYVLGMTSLKLFKLFVILVDQNIHNFLLVTLINLVIWISEKRVSGQYINPRTISPGQYPPSKVPSLGLWLGGTVEGGNCPGDIVQGGYCPGVIVRGVIVRGDIVLEPEKSEY